jgi:hypothetical protein
VPNILEMFATLDRKEREAHNPPRSCRPRRLRNATGCYCTGITTPGCV